MNDQFIFWDTLEQEANRCPHHLLLPRIELNGLEFDAILLTSSAVYLFFMLPADMRNLSISGRLMESQREGELLNWKRGAGETVITAVQKELELSSLPIFECYILPSKWSPVRIVDHASLILSCDLFPSFLQQIGGIENEAVQHQQRKLYQHLKEAGETKEVLKGTTDKVLSELEGSWQQVAAIAIPEQSYMGLPPRQAKRKDERKENMFLLLWRLFFKKRRNGKNPL